VPEFPRTFLLNHPPAKPPPFFGSLTFNKPRRGVKARPPGYFLPMIVVRCGAPLYPEPVPRRFGSWRNPQTSSTGAAFRRSPRPPRPPASPGNAAFNQTPSSALRNGFWRPGGDTRWNRPVSPKQGRKVFLAGTHCEINSALVGLGDRGGSCFFARGCTMRGGVGGAAAGLRVNARF